MKDVVKAVFVMLLVIITVLVVFAYNSYRSKEFSSGAKSTASVLCVGNRQVFEYKGAVVFCENYRLEDSK